MKSLRQSDVLLSSEQLIRALMLSVEAVGLTLHDLKGSSPKSVIEDEAFLVQRLASEVAGLNPRFI
jgi:hypothetical protein